MILILGAKGMLGQALAKELADFKPTLWDREEVDATNTKELRAKIYEIRPVIIINCVAMTDVDGCEDNPELAHNLNVEVPKSLSEISNEIDAVLVQYSTAYIFEGAKQTGYKEDDFPNPQSIYAKTKLEGEREAAKSNKHYIIRLDRLFGSPGSGKMSFVEKILNAATKQAEVKVIDDEQGSPTYAPDIAKITREILEQKKPYGIYHGSNAGGCSWYEWAKEIFKIKNINVPLVPVAANTFQRKAVRPKYGILLNTKLPPQRSWQLALQEYLSSNS